MFDNFGIAHFITILGYTWELFLTNLEKLLDFYPKTLGVLKIWSFSRFVVCTSITFVSNDCSIEYVPENVS